MKSQGTRGLGNRYAKDGGGNHIDSIKAKQSPSYFRDYSKKLCSSCGQKKTVKGGSRIGKRFVCADCAKP